MVFFWYSPDGSVPLHDYIIKIERFFCLFSSLRYLDLYPKKYKSTANSRISADFPAWTHHSLWNFLKQNLDLGYKLRKLHELFLIHRWQFSGRFSPTPPTTWSTTPPSLAPPLPPASHWSSLPLPPLRPPSLQQLPPSLPPKPPPLNRLRRHEQQQSLHQLFKATVHCQCLCTSEVWRVMFYIFFIVVYANRENWMRGLPRVGIDQWKKEKINKYLKL